MEERRQQTFTFTSEAGLISFFAASLPRKQIKQIVDTLRSGFVPRDNQDPHEQELEFLKKCEFALVREIRTRSPQQNDTIPQP